MNWPAFLLFTSLIHRVQPCLVKRYSDPPKCECKSKALDSSNLATYASDHPFYETLTNSPTKAPAVSINDCTASFNCEEGYNLMILDTDTSTDFEDFGVDGICDPFKQTWLVDTDSGFKTFSRLYAICVSTETPPACTPDEPFSFLLAISNDFDESSIKSDLSYYFTGAYGITQRKGYATVAFDLTEEQDIQYFDNYGRWFKTIENYEANPSLAISDGNTGSDILNVIEMFLGNSNVSVCGARILVMLKRFPSNNETSKLVEKLRKFHVTVDVIGSSSFSGGSQYDVMYQLSSLTNGVYAFASSTSNFNTLSYAEPGSNYLFYSSNPQIIGTSALTLPSMKPHIMAPDGYSIVITSRRLIFPFKLKFHDTVSSHVLEFNSKTEFYKSEGNWCRWLAKFNESSTYDVTLEYESGVGPSQTLQIRMHYYSNPLNFWIPYDN